MLQKCTNKMKKGSHLFIEVACMDWKHNFIDELHLFFFDNKHMVVLLTQVKLRSLKISFFKILHSNLANPLRHFYKRLIGFFWRKGITYYHPERTHIKYLVNDDIQTLALPNFGAHKKHNEPAWWLRGLSKKE